MKDLLKCSLVFLLFCISSHALAGIVRGKVVDSKTGEPLIGAIVTLQGNGHTWKSTVQLDGSYVCKKVAAGSYSVTASYVEYANAPEARTEVTDTRNSVVDLSLEPKNSDLTAVQITSAAGSTDQKVRSLERNAATLQNNLSEKT